MASGSLVRDQENNLVRSAHRSVGKVQQYEFTMPLKNADLGDTLWERGQTYMIAILWGQDRNTEGSATMSG